MFPTASSRSRLGTITLSNDTRSGNNAQGCRAPVAGGTGKGGGLYSAADTLILSNDTTHLTSCSARAAHGTPIT